MSVIKPLLIRVIAICSISFMASASASEPEQAASPELTQVPGSRVFLVVPPGFTAAEHFSGFIHQETGAILYVELSPYMNGTSEWVYKSDVSIGGIPFRNWQRRIDAIPALPPLIGMGPEINIEGYAPASAADRVAESMEEAGRSAQTNVKAPFTPLEPGFKLRRSPGLRKVVFPQPSTDSWRVLYYNLSGTVDGLVSDKVIFTATFKPACAALTPLDQPRKEYEFWDFHDQADLDPRRHKLIQPMTLVVAGKLKGREIVVREKREYYPPREVYAAVFRDGISCYIVKGIFPPARRNQYLSQFKAAARSLVTLGPAPSPLPQAPAQPVRKATAPRAP